MAKVPGHMTKGPETYGRGSLDIWPRVPDIWPMVPDIWPMVPHISCRVLGIMPRVLDMWRRVPKIWARHPDIWVPEHMDDSPNMAEGPGHQGSLDL